MMKDAELVKLTPSQEKLMPKLQAFLEGPERIFRLKGKPGVGKTWCIRHALKALIEKDLRNRAPRGSFNVNVVGITFAHRAKNVLGEHIPHVYTFASAFGVKEVIDEFTGKRNFVHDAKSKRMTIGKHAIPVFVHDEVSQYTADMLRIVLAEHPLFSKIILMGDNAQLPPIEDGPITDADSPVWDLDLPDSCVHELTERVRQTDGNPILELTDMIREEIFGNQDLKRVQKALSNPKLDENGYGYEWMRYHELNKFLENEDPSRTILVAYRNKPINWFNVNIRNHLKNNPTDMLIDGDWLCMNDNFYGETPEGFPYLIHNSEVFSLNRVVKTKRMIILDGKEYEFDVYVSKIRRNREFVTPTEDSIGYYESVLENLADRARAGEIQWRWFWELKDSFCRWMYGYAVTAYKVQGSTYDRVIVDVNDILLCKALTPKRMLQAIYTAITRARENVYFLKAR